MSEPADPTADPSADLSADPSADPSADLSADPSAELGEESSAEHGARNRLLREGLRLFLQQGFSSVSTRQICAAAGVTQPSLYHHFGSKEGLYLAVVEQWFSDLHVAMTSAIAQGADLRDRLHRLAIFFWSGQAGEYQAMQHDALQHMPEENIRLLRVTIRESVVNPLLTLMIEGMANGDLPADANPYALLELFWAIVDGFTGLYHRGDPLPTPEQNTAAIDLFLVGARALTSDSFAAWPGLTPLDQLKPRSQLEHRS